MVKNLPANAGNIGDHGFNPWVGKIPWRRKWQPTPVFLPGNTDKGNPTDREAWRTIIHGVTKGSDTA